MIISEQTSNQVRDLCGFLFHAHKEEIDTAFLKAGNELTVSFSVKLAPAKKAKDPDDLDVDVSISFVKEKVKDSVQVIVNEKQARLFNEDAQ